MLKTEKNGGMRKKEKDLDTALKMVETNTHNPESLPKIRKERNISTKQKLKTKVTNISMNEKDKKKILKKYRGGGKKKIFTLITTVMSNENSKIKQTHTLQKQARH